MGKDIYSECGKWIVTVAHKHFKGNVVKAGAHVTIDTANEAFKCGLGKGFKIGALVTLGAVGTVWVGKKIVRAIKD